MSHLFYVRSIEWRATTSFSKHRIGYFYVNSTAVIVNGNDISYSGCNEIYINTFLCAKWDEKWKIEWDDGFNQKKNSADLYWLRIQFPYNAHAIPFKLQNSLSQRSNRKPISPAWGSCGKIAIPFCWTHQMGNLMENCWWKFISPHQPNWDLILIVIILSCQITLSPRWPLFKAHICFAIFTIYFRSTHHSKYYQTENSSGHNK